MLTAGIKHHVKEEEQEMFPALKRKLDRDELVALGDTVANATKGPSTASIAHGIGRSSSSSAPTN